MYQVGIDIGSSAAKTVVLRDGEIWKTMEMATGFSSRKTADEIYEWLEKEQVAGEGTRYGATGYGRVSVPYADKVITEITCHGKGAWKLFGKDGVVIDIGGQDTKGIVLKSGRVMKFVMNDKCSAGTGKFLEVMTNRLDAEGTVRIGFTGQRCNYQLYVYGVCGVRGDQPYWKGNFQGRYCLWCGGVGSCKSGTAYLAVRRKSLFSYWWTL